MNTNITDMSERPAYFTLHNGSKAALPFSAEEYARRLAGLRALMEREDVPVVVLTSMHNIAYYSGFLYCSFGRPYGLVVTADRAVTVSANIDGGQPWRRSVGENVIYTDWRRDNFWRAVRSLTGLVKRVGIERDHLTLDRAEKLAEFLGALECVDVSEGAMRQRLWKSEEERALIRSGAHIADLGGAAVIAAARVGAREVDVARAGREVMESAIARLHPESEFRDTWVWFQAGLNTDGAHNPLTCRRVEAGDILSLNTFPMISGYYTALERTLWMGEPDSASLKIWQTNVEAHELGLSLIRPGATCSGICAELNRFFADRGVLGWRSFGYGHSFGVLSHYYGRESGVELREDVDTELEAGMVVSMEPMLWVPEGIAGAGGYREHDILIVTESGSENLTKTPYGPEHQCLGL